MHSINHGRSGVHPDDLAFLIAVAERVGCAIVESINTIGRRLGGATMAEQAENEETLALLRGLGVDRAQGFVLARPQPLDALL